MKLTTSAIEITIGYALIEINSIAESPVDKGSRFDYLKKLLRAEVRNQLQQVIEGNSYGPVLVEFDPTTVCNYSCPECISSSLLSSGKIPGERIRTLMNEFARCGVKGVIFIGGGEPLAHEGTPAAMRQLHDLGVAVGLTTNGSLLHRDINTVAECVSWTRVSVDAATAETYATFRPTGINGAFNKVLSSMEQLAKKKKGALGYCFLVMQRSGVRYPEANISVVSNAREIYAAAKIAKEIGCDYFEFKPMVDAHHYLLPWSTELRAVIREQHQRCMELEGDDFEIIVPSSIDLLYHEDNPVQPKEYSWCPTMELRTLVSPTGVYPCPYHRGRVDKRLRAVSEDPFDLWWRSADRKLAAKKIDPRVDCPFYCIRHRTNLVVDAIAKLHAAGVPLLNHLREYKHIDDPFL